MATVHVEMHGEHRQWLSDNSMWRDDLTLWQKEIDQALDGMKKLEDALREHRKGLQGHLDTSTVRLVAEFARIQADPGRENPEFWRIQLQIAQ